MRLVGKISMDELRKYVFPHTGAPDDRVLVGQMVGGDATVINLGDKCLVLKADPITGAVENIGRLAVKIASNDVASMGAKPEWFLPILILPTSKSVEDVEQIMKQIDEVAKELGVAVVGGHTEFITGIDHPIICGFMAALTERGGWVASRGAKPGDKIILTKGVAIEGTYILATDMAEEVREAFGPEFLSRAEAFAKSISVVEEALEAVRAGGVTGMHDPTEGGIATALHEIAEASGTGFLVFKDRIHVAEETRLLCSHFNLDPLQTISSGSLIITIKSEACQGVVKAIRKLGIRAEVIGEVKEAEFGRKIALAYGKLVDLHLPLRDDLWKLFDEITRGK